MALSDGILAMVEAGSLESDLALLNLMTIQLQAGSTESSQSLATRLRESTQTSSFATSPTGPRKGSSRVSLEPREIFDSPRMRRTISEANIPITSA